ncbi:ABC transporter permease [Actinophytocola algeriensis]|uniref:Peptide/nickel transport system permease protein n=1 Tax=Actinophytocola algeriensis TaxID=1768010 RepID=A0A7W7QF27_9PSEU|nr:ABC transporter permease [Actinophytocola algeriensis]MBB4911936.1 peptide/nickel transport system permease protein [Actinophytocola algeriensis]MBE1477572.1 peptide/nickel transport system permease protein [Actinophytocola algeriensis]
MTTTPDPATAAQAVFVESAEHAGPGEAPEPQQQGKQKSHGQFADMWRRFRRNRLAMAGLVVVVILIVLALLQPVISPYDPYDQNLLNTLASPGGDHLMGTDALGRDLFSGLLYGLRLALLVGLLTMLGSMTLGVTLGALAGYRGKIADGLVMRTTDIFLAFPFLIGAILVVRTFGTGVFQVIIALVILGWPTAARLMRGQILALRESEYVEAARSIGASDWRIVTRHILPNAIQPVFIYSFTSIGVAVVAMASLAYLGVGVPPDTPEWGRMINMGIEQVQVAGKDFLWMFPSAAICLTTLVFAFVADGLRDSLDPKLR